MSTASSITYNGTLSIGPVTLTNAENATNMRLITATVTWQSGKAQRGRTMNIGVAEAGIEEGMSHLNSESGQNHVFEANGWTKQPDGTYQITRFLDTSYYTVTITIPSNTPPIVTSQGFVPVPVAAVNLNPGTTTYVSRTGQVLTKFDGLLTVALAVKQQVDFKGSNNATDSFDSGDPNYSTLGMYDSTKTKANGDVVTDYAAANSINVGSSKIKGTIRTGPGGTVSVGAGSDIYDFVGAGVCYQLKFNGNFNFHYDEALRRIGPGRGYVANSWTEL